MVFKCDKTTIGPIVFPEPFGSTLAGFAGPFGLNPGNLLPNIPDLSEWLSKFSLPLPVAQEIKPTNSGNNTRDLGGVVTELINSFLAGIVPLKYLLVPLFLLGCIIEFLCAVPNPFKMPKRLARIFSKCIPMLLTLFPLIALLILLLALILLILALILALIAMLLAYLLQFIDCALGIKEAIDNKNLSAICSFEACLALLPKELRNALSMLLSVLALIDALQGLLRFGMSFPCKSGKKPFPKDEFKLDFDIFEEDDDGDQLCPKVTTEESLAHGIDGNFVDDETFDNVGADLNTFPFDRVVKPSFTTFSDIYALPGKTYNINGADRLKDTFNLIEDIVETVEVTAILTPANTIEITEVTSEAPNEDVYKGLNIFGRTASESGFSSSMNVRGQYPINEYILQNTFLETYNWNGGAENLAFPGTFLNFSTPFTFQRRRLFAPVKHATFEKSGSDYVLKIDPNDPNAESSRATINRLTFEQFTLDDVGKNILIFQQENKTNQVVSDTNDYRPSSFGGTKSNLPGNPAEDVFSVNKFYTDQPTIDQVDPEDIFNNPGIVKYKTEAAMIVGIKDGSFLEGTGKVAILRKVDGSIIGSSLDKNLDGSADIHGWIITDAQTDLFKSDHLQSSEQIDSEGRDAFDQIHDFFPKIPKLVVVDKKGKKTGDRVVDEDREEFGTPWFLKVFNVSGESDKISFDDGEVDRELKDGRVFSFPANNIFRSSDANWTAQDKGKILKIKSANVNSLVGDYVITQVLNENTVRLDIPNWSSFGISTQVINIEFDTVTSFTRMGINFRPDSQSTPPSGESRVGFIVEPSDLNDNEKVLLTGTNKMLILEDINIAVDNTDRKSEYKSNPKYISSKRVVNRSILVPSSLNGTANREFEVEAEIGELMRDNRVIAGCHGDVRLAIDNAHDNVVDALNAGNDLNLSFDDTAENLLGDNIFGLISDPFPEDPEAEAAFGLNKPFPRRQGGLIPDMQALSDVLNSAIDTMESAIENIDNDDAASVDPVIAAGDLDNFLPPLIAINADTGNSFNKLIQILLDPIQTGFVVDKQTVIADNIDFANITITPRDFSSNNIAAQKPDIADFKVIINTDFGDLSDVTDNGDGTFVATIKSDEVGTANITASVLDKELKVVDDIGNAATNIKIVDFVEVSVGIPLRPDNDEGCE